MQYSGLLELAKLDPEKVDFRELRRCSTLTALYSPCVRYYDIFDSAQGLIDKGKLNEARNSIYAILDRDYLNIRAHLMVGSISEKLGENSDASRHRHFAKRLLDSIFESGDGRSFDTAFEVINIIEEYDVIGVLGLTLATQTFVKNKGHQFDILTVHDNSSHSFDLYFNIDLPKGWLDRQIGQKFQSWKNSKS